jgi:modulator of FtsH protease
LEHVESWTDFLVASAGATAALAGLLFVALSINLAKILELPQASGRAGETLVILSTGLIGSLLALIPGMERAHLGLAFIALWVPTWLGPSLIQVRTFRHHDYFKLSLAILRSALYQLATIPLLLAGLSLLGWIGGGLYWFAAALILSLVVALFSAWVLLVEILR